MTLILSYCTKGYVCQISDRLVSKRYASGRTQPDDPWFNKQILFMAKDGLFSIGFSGLGHISDMPTDQWIASIVANEPLEAGGMRRGGIGTRLRSGPRTFPSHWLDIGRAVRRLRDACALTFAGFRQKQQQSNLEAGLTIVVVGHQYKLRWHGSYADTKRIRPVLYKLAYSEKPYPGVHLNPPLGRYWGWEHGDSYLDSTPELPDDLRSTLRDRMLQEGSVTTDERIEAILIQGIREVAKDPQRGVSSDCLSISLMPSRDPAVLVRYNPLASPYSTTMQGASAPLIFSGWIIMPGWLQEPQVSVLPTGMTKTAGPHGISVGFEGPQAPGNMAVQTTQPRKRRPRR